VVQLVRILLELRLASRITWYWLTCVYMVLICRWPKASYSVLSMVEGAMPSARR
jgi:hypothetical protein